MHTEIKEAVAWLFRFYRHNSPRRRIALLMTEFANLLLNKYQESWDVNDPKRGEDSRMIDLTRKDAQGRLLEKLFVLAAEEMLCPEVLNRTPDVKLFINPGQVYYNVSRDIHPVIIWSGDVHADIHYNPMPMGVVNKPVNRPPTLLSAGKSVYLSENAKNVTINSDIEDHSPLILHLLDSHPLVYESPINKPIKKFVYHSPDHRPMSVVGFARTRFGSNKTRPDHDNYKRLQHAAGQAAMVGLFPASPTTPFSGSFQY